MSLEWQLMAGINQLVQHGLDALLGSDRDVHDIAGGLRSQGFGLDVPWR